jgi:hypothetical protein
MFGLGGAVRSNSSLRPGSQERNGIRQLPIGVNLRGLGLRGQDLSRLVRRSPEGLGESSPASAAADWEMARKDTSVPARWKRSAFGLGCRSAIAGVSSIVPSAGGTDIIYPTTDVRRTPYQLIGDVDTGFVRESVSRVQEPQVKISSV